MITLWYNPQEIAKRLERADKEVLANVLSGYIMAYYARRPPHRPEGGPVDVAQEEFIQKLTGVLKCPDSKS